jgi:tagatose 1,6-diphosphate aldolase GatY/KbaY
VKVPEIQKVNDFMPYVTTTEMLGKARQNNYAVCAFNAENLEMVQAIIWGAEEMLAPVIIQTTPSTIKYTDCAYFHAIVKTAAENSCIPAALHLDHGNNFDLVCKAIKSGYSSVMIDASQKSFEENINITQKVAELAKAVNIPVEAELGQVGGKEDGLESDGGIYTNPGDAVEFVRQTGINSLAVAIGTAHGIYKTQPKLDLARLSEIKKALKEFDIPDIPLVLHGATGLSDEIIKECVKLGINKINFATELRLTYTNAVREKLNSNENENIIDVKIYSGYARERVKELVKEKIRLSGSAGRV